MDNFIDIYNGFNNWYFTTITPHNNIYMPLVIGILILSWAASACVPIYGRFWLRVFNFIKPVYLPLLLITMILTALAYLPLMGFALFTLPLPNSIFYIMFGRFFDETYSRRT
jgi:hypothetical protein